MIVNKGLMHGYRMLGTERTREIFRVARAQSVLDRGHIANEIMPDEGHASDLIGLAGGLIGLIAGGAGFVNLFRTVPTRDLATEVIKISGYALGTPVSMVLGGYAGLMLAYAASSVCEEIARYGFHRDFDKAEEDVNRLNKENK